MNDAVVFKVLDTFQKGVRYVYLGLSILFIFGFLNGTLQDIDKWIEPVMLWISRIEMGLIAFYLGLKVSILTFEKIEGDVLGTDVNNLIRFWKWSESKTKELLIYNGALGIMLISLYMK